MVDLDTIVSLCKRRGFVFQSSEIYGGLGSAWDYGPLGVEFKNNIKRLWWRDNVHRRDDMVGLDAAITMHPTVWKASGHADHFADPFTGCVDCNRYYRADHLADALKSSKWFRAVEETLQKPEGKKKLDNWRKNDGRRLAPNLPWVKDPNAALPEALAAVGGCPACGGRLSDPKPASLMLTTTLGPVEATGTRTYLRPETAQGIFVNFDNVLQSARKKLPFGIAQIGKSFRNEITPGNFTFRTREFEQMELEFFVKPGTDEEWHQKWIDERFAWYQRYGIRKENIKLREHEKPHVVLHDGTRVDGTFAEEGHNLVAGDRKIPRSFVKSVEAGELAHYAKRCVDIEYLFPMGWSELEGIANRTDYDLKQHAQFSGKALDYFDDETKQKVIPYVIEPAAGADRSALAFLIDAYHEEEVRGEKRVVLRFHPEVAPIKVAVLPLLKKNDKIVATAKSLVAGLREQWHSVYDDTAAIGKLYRRQDEIGTPFCVTVDVQTIGDETTAADNRVTIRERDSMQQIRVPAAELPAAMRELMAGRWTDVAKRFPAQTSS